MGFLTILEQIWGLFFQNDVLVQDRSGIIKKCFSELFLVLKMIFIQFWVIFDKMKKTFFQHFPRQNLTYNPEVT